MKNKNQAVIIITDTQRTDMLGCYGNRDMITPNLDKLASEGILFSKAYTCQPVCGPARSAMFTGTYPHTNGSWSNSMPLGLNVKTLGQRLCGKKIKRGHIGKWHLDGSDYFGTGSCPEGWDPNYWYDMRNYLEDMNDNDRRRSRSPQLNRDPDLSEDFTFAHKCTDRAIDFLENHKDDDFLLVLSYDEPHHPSICPKPFSELYTDYILPRLSNEKDTLDGKPEHQKVWAGKALEEDRSSFDLKAPDFLGCNSYVDYEIGRFLKVAEVLIQKAFIIYTSDHGDFLGSHRLSGKGAAMYDEITNIPFIVKYPGIASEGKNSDNLVSHIDIAPTMLDFFGFPIPPTMEGKSFLPMLEDPGNEINDAIFIEFSRYEIDHDGFGGFQPIRCVRDKRFKLVINLLSGDELYDLDQDPAELINLIERKKHIAIRNKLHNRLLKWMNETRDPFRGYYWERRPWRKDARDATWDYTGMTRQRENETGELRQLDYSTGMEMKNSTRRKEGFNEE